MSADASDKLQSQYILYNATIFYLASMILCGTILNITALKLALKVNIIAPTLLIILSKDKFQRVVRSLCNLNNVIFQGPKTEQNMILVNTFVCQLLIALFAIPLDLIGVLSNGSYLGTIVCPFLAFVHTMFGKIISLS